MTASTSREINFRTAITVYIGNMEAGVLYSTTPGEAECKVCEAPSEFFFDTVADFAPSIPVCSPDCAGKWVKDYA